MTADSDLPYANHSLTAAAAPGLPEAGALALAGGRAVLVSPDGEVRDLTRLEARGVLDREALVVCHAGFLAQRLGRPRPARRADLFDLTELFAFVRPARFCLPTARGLAEALEQETPDTPEDEAVALVACAHALLAELGHRDYPNRHEAAALAQTMGARGWSWARFVMAALQAEPARLMLGGLNVWERMPEWEDRAPQGGRSSDPVAPEDAQARLDRLLGDARSLRPGQDRYVAAATAAFAPRDVPDEPHVALAEAGTGIGKTLGYIAPASLWAEKNGPGVWISTYTKNLQRQIDQELETLYPDPLDKTRRAVIRKGRENYLCLLNFEDAAKRAVSGVGQSGEDPVSLGLVARWLLASRDGDMVGGDFPAWLAPPGLIHGTRGASGAQGLTDRRGECIYAACPHYRKCTIEKATRKARHAHLVIANHALVMHQAALDQGLAAARADDEDGLGPERRLRLIFDEGHHLFDAADAAFGACLSAGEAAELRRWVRGTEARGQRRARGLPDRVGDLTTDDTESHLHAALEAARDLPAEGWATRQGEGAPRGAAEGFFALLRRHVEARADKPDSPRFGLECAVHPLAEDILPAAARLATALDTLAAALAGLSTGLRERLNDEAETLETPTRLRIEAVTRGLDRRALLMIPSWQAMLRALSSDTPDSFVDWFALERIAGRVVDVAMHRRYVDPMEAFTRAVVRPAHGVLVTSATLRDDAPRPETAAEPTDATPEDWDSADIRTGARHLPDRLVSRTRIASPFDYAAQTRVLVVRDLSQASMDQLASAYRELFKAAGGGGLGLFTAIQRLRAVHERIADPIEAAGLPLYAQHVDAMDIGTLVDIFRAEEDACLLGTDAVRDGVDVPGRSLRLIVFDRVPWPRPDLLHKARRAHFGARTYDDALTRLRLKQAFGRLVRGPQDRGVFVLLDPRLPTRLTGAFPPGVTVERIGLSEAVSIVSHFLKTEDSDAHAARGPLARPQAIA